MKAQYATFSFGLQPKTENIHKLSVFSDLISLLHRNYKFVDVLEFILRNMGSNY